MAKKGEQVIAVKFSSGRTFQVQDLPVAKIDEIAKAQLVSWTTVVDSPFDDAGVAEALVRAVAAWIGPEVSVPEPLTVRELIPMFVMEEQTLPDPVEVPGDPPTS